MKDAGTSEVPLSHKTVAEPKIMVGKGNPYQGGNSICFFSFLFVCFVPMIAWCSWILRINHYFSDKKIKII